MTASMQSAMTFFAIVIIGITLGGCSGAMVMNYVIDHIPMWVWMVVGLGGIGALLYFFSPILIPIWRILPTPVKIALVAAFAGTITYFGGRYRGRFNADEERRQRNAEALRKRVEVDNEVAHMDDKTVQTKLDRWTRDEP